MAPGRDWISGARAARSRARRERPADLRGPAVYSADLAQFPVVGLVHYPLAERIQSFVQHEGQRDELGAERADHWM